MIAYRQQVSECYKNGTCFLVKGSSFFDCKKFGGPCHSSKPQCKQMRGVNFGGRKFAALKEEK